MTEAEQLKRYAEALARFRHDPLGFVMWAYPWEVAGSFLENETGPDDWQREQLVYIGDQLRRDPHTPIKMVTSSGNGAGKSSLVSWLIHWATMTSLEVRGVVTANSDNQLKTKTWSELSKWTHLHLEQFTIGRQVFELTATRFYAKAKPMDWRVDAIPNSKSNPAAFSGLHNAGKRIIVIFDEASEIPDIIWDMTEGAMTDAETEIIWACFGNPTQPIGRFKEVAKGRLRRRWRWWKVDTRTVKRTNKKEIEDWARAYGEDSDWFRTRVTGEFPDVGSMQLIENSLVQAAREREPLFIPSDPLVAGLDVARFGDDSSVLVFRRGRDAKSIPRKEWKGVNTMTLAAAVALEVMTLRVDALFVDVGSFGAGVYDQLINLVGRKINIYPIDFGGKEGIAYMNGVQARVANPAAAMWVNMREWLSLGAIEDDEALEADLTGRKYGYKGEAIVLERKQDMKARGLASPDWADALALTFAMPIAPRNVASSAEEIDRVNGSLAGGGDGFASIMERAMMDVR